MKTGETHCIPFGAWIPADESQCNTLWVNQHGQRKPRDVLGDKVLIRQQPAAPPKETGVLVLTDEMLASFQRPDRYIRCLLMFGYMFRNYTQDIKDEN